MRRLTRLLGILAGVAVSVVSLTAFEASALSCRTVVPNPHESIQWFTTDPRARDELARWCGSVGPVIFSSHSVPSESLLTDRFVIVSWNVHVGAGNVDSFVAELRRGDLTGGRPVHDFVLLLQEEFREGDDVPAVLPHGLRPPSPIAASTQKRGREGVRAAASAIGASVFYVPSMRNGGVVRPVEDRGNAIISTVPIRDPAAIELPLEHQRRVAIAVSICGRRQDGVPWTLRLVDVHLDTALALLHGGPFAARRRQAQALVTAIDHDEAPTVVAGDFNTWGGSHESALTVFQRAFALSDLSQVADDSGPTFHGPLGFRAVLDHAFARGVRSLTVTRLSRSFGSDHVPLIVEVAF